MAQMKYVTGGSSADPYTPVIANTGKHPLRVHVVAVNSSSPYLAVEPVPALNIFMMTAGMAIDFDLSPGETLYVAGGTVCVLASE